MRIQSIGLIYFLYMTTYFTLISASLLKILFYVPSFFDFIAIQKVFICFVLENKCLGGSEFNDHCPPLSYFLGIQNPYIKPRAINHPHHSKSSKSLDESPYLYLLRNFGRFTACTLFAAAWLDIKMNSLSLVSWVSLLWRSG
jgi:hypothetical protein